MLKEKAKRTSPTTPKPTKKTIATSPTPKSDDAPPHAQKLLAGNKLRSKVSAIARRLKKDGCKTSETLIKQKIFELYPNEDDWIGTNPDAQQEVIKALKRDYQANNLSNKSTSWEDKASSFLDEVRWQ